MVTWIYNKCYRCVTKDNAGASMGYNLHRDDLQYQWNSVYQTASRLTARYGEPPTIGCAPLGVKASISAVITKCVYRTGAGISSIHWVVVRYQSSVCHTNTFQGNCWLFHEFLTAANPDTKDIVTISHTCTFTFIRTTATKPFPYFKRKKWADILEVVICCIDSWNSGPVCTCTLSQVTARISS